MSRRPAAALDRYQVLLHQFSPGGRSGAGPHDPSKLHGPPQGVHAQPPHARRWATMRGQSNRPDPREHHDRRHSGTDPRRPLRPHRPGPRTGPRVRRRAGGPCPRGRGTEDQPALRIPGGPLRAGVGKGIHRCPRQPGRVRLGSAGCCVQNRSQGKGRSELRHRRRRRYQLSRLATYRWDR